MTTDENPTLAPLVDALEEFGRRVASGLRARSDATVESSPATLETMSTSDLASIAPRGALLGRTKWALETGERDGAFLWIGGWEMLLGQEPRAAELLATDDIALLEQSLRLMLDEEGEGPAPFDWISLEGIEGEKLGEALATLGLRDEFDAVQIRVGLGEEEVRFLFVASPNGAAPGLSATRVSAPTQRFEALSEVAAPRAASHRPAPSDTESTDESPDLSNLRHLLDVKIPLKIRLGSTRMSLDEVLRIAPGAILELDRREEEPFEVLANGRVIARGEVVVVDERFGLRITEIGTSSERLRVAG